MIQTERLLLRKITLEDAPFIQQLVNTETWIKNIGDKDVNDLNSAQQFIQSWALDRYNLHGFGPYLVLLGNEPIGVNGLFKREHLEYPDIGFALLPSYMGKGYAYESSKAIMIQAKEKGFKKLYAFTNPDNSSSQKLLNKLGFEQSTHQEDEKSVLFEYKI